MLPLHISRFLINNAPRNLLFFLAKCACVLLSVFVGLSCSRSQQKTDQKTVFIKQNKKGFELYRKGRPFRIKGVSSGGSLFRTLRNTGANTLRVYDTLKLGRVLDSAQQHHLAVVVDLSLPTFDPNSDFYENQSKTDKLVRSIQNTIEAHKNHPALLLWNLGNEINFPSHPKYAGFYDTYTQLVDRIHALDPNHPITTSISSKAIRKRILSIQWYCPQLDFISINVFGRLTAIQKDLKAIYWLWKGPYLISEWGNNGPWESDYTAWNAPIEDTSAKKAAQCKLRYLQEITADTHRCLGSLLFYWGQKQERTPTWFSLFDRSGAQSQTVQEMQQLWSPNPISNHAPEITYMLLDQRGARDNILFRPGIPKSATLKFSDPDQDALTTCWEILPESWAYPMGTKQYEPPNMNHLIQDQSTAGVSFVTPKKEGAYRLFAYLYDGQGNFATTNTPFYVLKSIHE